MSIFEEFEQEGFKIGVQIERTRNVLSLWQKGFEPNRIASLFRLPIEQVEKYIADAKVEAAV